MQDFLAMPDQDQVDFWRWAQDEIGDGRTITGKKKTQTLVDRVTHVVSTNQVKRARAACNNEYRPLEFWVREGFDRESILKNCQTTKEDEIQGTLYRVGLECVDAEVIKFETIGRLRAEEAKFPPLRKKKKDKKDKKKKKGNKGNKNTSKRKRRVFGKSK